MIITRTPFRLSFFGGGSDYPTWYRNHGGSVLATTIDKYCYLNCRYYPPFFEHRFRAVYAKSENCKTIEEISHPAIRGVLQYLDWNRGVEIHHIADLPARAGIGSSSAFIVGLLHALYGLRGKIAAKSALAAESIYIEQFLLKEIVGSQDQVSAAYGGLNHIRFLKSGDFEVQPVTVAKERIKELESHLMLFYTGIKRTAATVAQTYIGDLETRRSQIERLVELVDAGLAVLQGQGDILELGSLLNEAWQVKKTVATRITNREVDHIYARAQAAGALGGKITGAGGGGFMMLFVPPEWQGRVREALSTFIHVPFKFDHSGSQVVHYSDQEEYGDVERDLALRKIVESRELEDAKL